MTSPTTSWAGACACTRSSLRNDQSLLLHAHLHCYTDAGSTAQRPLLSSRPWQAELCILGCITACLVSIWVPAWSACAALGCAEGYVQCKSIQSLLCGKLSAPGTVTSPPGCYGAQKPASVHLSWHHFLICQCSQSPHLHRCHAHVHSLKHQCRSETIMITIITICRWHWEMAQLNAVVRALIRMVWGTALAPGSYTEALACYQRAAAIDSTRLVHRCCAPFCVSPHQGKLPAAACCEQGSTYCHRNDVAEMSCLVPLQEFCIACGI